MSSVALRIQTTRAADQTFQPTRRHDGRARRLDSRWSELDPPRLERLSLRDAPPHLVESLSEIEQTSLSAAELVRQLMLFARKDTSPAKAPIDPAAMLRRVLHICRTTFERAVRLELEVGPHIPIRARKRGPARAGFPQHLQQRAGRACECAARGSLLRRRDSAQRRWAADP
jgi:signal transduction histidine kinase